MKKPRPERTPAELREASVLVIEALESLHGSYRELERMASKRLDGDDVSLVAWDGVLGSWTVHARKLIDFIERPAERAWPDDILADDFVPPDSAWPEVRPRLLDQDELRRRIGKEIAHLTYPSGRKDPGWEVGPATREVARAITVFVHHAPKDRLTPEFVERADAVAIELIQLHPDRI